MTTAETLSLKHYTVTRDADNIVWVTMDVADKSENVLDVPVLSELGDIVTALENDTTVRGMGLLSAKRNFIMGADINAFSDLKTPDEITVLLDKAHDVLDRLESLTIPTACAINGFCLGGGLEVALAFKYRVVLNDEAHKTKSSIGFPEVKLGIFPGFGGTFRSIAQLGAMNALPMMLSGRSYKPNACRAMGIAHKLVDNRGQMRWVMRKALLRGKMQTPTAKFWQRAGSVWGVRSLIANKMEREVTKKANPDHYPAPHCLINMWRQLGDNPAKMQALEKTNFADMMLTRTARNLQRIYHISNAMKGLAKKAPKSAPKIQNIHVIGAGTMGADIAIHCVVRGFNVTLQDLNPDMLQNALGRATKYFKKRLRDPLLVERALARFKLDSDGVGVQSADVVIEAIVEDLDIKTKVFRQVEKTAPAHAILATNTSAIPLEEIAKNMQDKTRLIGLHFFNPAHTLPLVEVVQSKTVTDDWVALGAKFAKDLGKFPLIVKSSPGFLVNRVLAPYMLRAVEWEQAGEYDRDTIDYACRLFGMPVGPLELCDSVGLDIVLSVADTLNLPTDGAERLTQWVADGKLGRKTGQGYYRWQNGKPIDRKVAPHARNLKHIAHEILSPLWTEAQTCLDEKIIFEKDTQTSADLIDGGLIFGIGFAPHLGGALHYAKTLEKNKGE